MSWICVWRSRQTNLISFVSAEDDTPLVFENDDTSVKELDVPEVRAMPRVTDGATLNELLEKADGTRILIPVELARDWLGWDV